MPVYEYLCQDCSSKFEIEASLSEKEKGLKATCPHCSSKKIIQIFGKFFTTPKGEDKKSDGCCGSKSGCCG